MTRIKAVAASNNCRVTPDDFVYMRSFPGQSHNEDFSVWRSKLALLDFFIGPEFLLDG